MSDVSRGPDWWLGTDGKWYPPVAPASPEPSSPPLRLPPPPPGATPLGDGTPPPGEPGPPAPTRRSGLVVAVVALVVVLLGAVGAVAVVTLLGGSTSHTVTGTFTLYSTDSISTVGGCQGSRGYDDIRVGADVVLKDGSGEVLATGALEDPSYRYGECTFTFELTDVPDRDFYAFTVTHRGDLTYSRSELEQRDWRIEASLGDD